MHLAQCGAGTVAHFSWQCAENKLHSEDILTSNASEIKFHPGAILTSNALKIKYDSF